MHIEQFDPNTDIGRVRASFDMTLAGWPATILTSPSGPTTPSRASGHALRHRAAADLAG
jgi:hypothetical protein